MAASPASRSLLLAHLWMPVLSTLGLSWGYAQAEATSTFSVVGVTALCSGVLFVYTVDRLLEPGRVEAGARAWLWSVSLIAVVASLWAALGDRRVLLVQVALGLCSVAYIPMKRVPAAKTVLVSVTWWLGCTLLPFPHYETLRAALLALAHPAGVSIALSVAAGAIMCDYKDEGSDAAEGVRSLPLLLGRRRSSLLTASLLLLAGALAVTAHAPILLAVALLLLALGMFPRLLRRRLLGPLSVDAALAAPGAVSLLWP